MKMKEERSYKLLIAVSIISILLLPVYGQSTVGVSKCVTKCQEVHCPLDVNQKLEDCVLKHENNADRYDCGKELDIPAACSSCASDCARMHVYNVCKGHVAAYRANMLKTMLQMNADGSDITQQQQQVPSTEQDLDGPK